MSVLDTLKASFLSLHNHAMRWYSHASFMDKETKAKLFKAGIRMEVIYALEVCKA